LYQQVCLQQDICTGPVLTRLTKAAATEAQLIYPSAVTGVAQPCESAQTAMGAGQEVDVVDAAVIG